MAHHFTVDVEEYYQVSALEPYVRRDEWDSYASRVRDSVEMLLAMLSRYQSRGTFFVLGMVAERHPGLVKEIAGHGHEIASHGWDHRRVTQQTPDAFRDSVRRSKRLLEDITNAPVLGFRAPSYSIVPGLEWALDILVEEGYAYDSSLFPIMRKGYGYPGANRDPYVLTRSAGSLHEIPPATLRRWGMNLPAAGGGYFRLLPYWLVRAALRECEARGTPGTFYIHPWELDVDQPRLNVNWVTRVRHYGGLARTRKRLEKLLSEFEFVPVADQIPTVAAVA